MRGIFCSKQAGNVFRSLRWFPLGVFAVALVDVFFLSCRSFFQIASRAVMPFW